jgi:L-glyceraldehyde 3-phosphate reductase
MNATSTPRVAAAIARTPVAPELSPAERPPYVADPGRYDVIGYRYTGRSGLQLPQISLGLWHNFGDDVPFASQRALVRRAFDLGVTQFDLANNYGPPYGSAEENLGRIFVKDLRPYRDELVITTKAGWDMWPGPYGFLGSRKYMLASLDRSLARLGLDHVDIFYSHRFDADTPLEETMGALHSAVQQGKARYVGISSYAPERTREAIRILAGLGTPLLIHQPNYSMFNRWIEEGLLDVLGEAGVGCIPFSPLAQGLLTDRYLKGIPAGSRGSQDKSMSSPMFSTENLERVKALNQIARRRGQSLAQMAILWVLRDKRVTSALIGASSITQLEDSLGALDGAPFDDEELAQIDRYAATISGVDLWSDSTRG